MNSCYHSPLLVIVGTTPPPTNGQTVATEMLLVHLVQQGLPHVLIYVPARQGCSVTSLILQHARSLLRFCRVIAVTQCIVYITIAQSRKGFWRDVPYVWIARVCRRTVICHLHGGNYAPLYLSSGRLFRWMIRHTLAGVNKIIILSEALREMFAFSPRLQAKLVVVPNCLPTELPPAARKTLPTDDTPIRLLFLSNLIESKGYFQVLDAVKLLRCSGLNVTVDFCGEFLASPDDIIVKNAASAKALFAERVRMLAIDANVCYHGIVTGEHKQALLAAAHFFVLPTRYVHEGQPLSILEAMAHGAVVVATHFRAIPEMVLNGHTGVLLAEADGPSIARAISDVVTSPTMFSSMSEAALKHCREHFSPSHGRTLLLRAITSGSWADCKCAVMDDRSDESVELNAEG